MAHQTHVMPHRRAIGGGGQLRHMPCALIYAVDSKGKRSGFFAYYMFENCSEAQPSSN